MEARVHDGRARRAAARRGGSGSSGSGRPRCRRPRAAPTSGAPGPPSRRSCRRRARRDRGRRRNFARYRSQTRLAQVRQPAARRVAVVHRLGRGLGELLDRDRGRGDVGVAEAEVDHVAALAPQLALQLVDRREDVGREIVDSPKLHVCQWRGVRPCRLRSSAAASARASIRPSQTVSAPAASGRSSRSTTGTRSPRTVTRERIEAGPRSLWRYADLLPAEPPADAASGPGFTPLVPAPRLASALGRRRGLPQARPLEPDALVQGPRRRGRRGEGARVRPRHALGTSTGNLANAVAARAAATGHARGDLLPGRARAREVRGDDGLRRDDLRRPRQLRRLLAPRQRARRRGRLGHRQRQPALVLRRGLEDARVRDRRAARLGDARRGRDADRLRRDVHEGLARASSSSAASGSSSGAAAEAVRRPGRGLRARSRPRSPRTGASRRCGRSPMVSSIAIGNPADGDLAIATRARVGRRRLLGPRGRGRRRTSRSSPRRPASSARARPAWRSARSARRSPAASSARTTASSLLVTGTGLKTPQLADAAGAVVEIEPDVDALLDELGVTA